jgi:5,6,7,8-tetrahydromethanopterin hydro-lyase
VKPLTLFVNKADIRDEEQGRLVWGAAQAGVAGGVADAVAAGVIPAAEVDALLVIAAVWVDWAAAGGDADAVYANNREATHSALAAGVAGQPAVADVLAARDHPANAYYRSGRLPG